MPAPTELHTLSVACYSRGIGHRGLALHLSDPSTTTCKMHHIRNPSESAYIYDPREQPLDDTTLWGRHAVTSTLTPAQAAAIERTLTAFGADDTNIPAVGTGNCQNWLAAALHELGFAADAAFWRDGIGREHEELAGMVREMGGVWVEGKGVEEQAVADAS
ncbi:hypothetical protein EDC01DRAFT_634030 [Geopyxis carbonaria]|nr:hypothetical protein EDC01DRAFT_634030 [Geopyxis carbonaria]